jgi:hypothetical protein
MNWYMVDWAYTGFREQTYTELIFGAEDQLRDQVAAIHTQDNDPNMVIIYGILKYPIATGGHC